jgi:hypothetical protein
LSGEIAETDLLVEVDEIRSLGTEEFDFGAVESWSMRVVDVLHAAEVGSKEQESDTPPSIGPGDEFVVGSARPGIRDPQVHEFGEVSGRAIISARYVPPHLIRGHKSVWVINYLATVDAQGGWTFHNLISGGVWRIQLSELSDRFPALSDSELIRAWTMEADAERRGEEAGPITLALRDLSQRDLYSDWFGLPEDERPLDPELTPPEILSALKSVEILVDIESAPQDEDRFLVIKTDSGIVHAVSLAAGNHALEVLAQLGDDWRVVVTDKPVRGSDVLVAGITASEWESAAASGDILLIRYDESEMGTAEIVSGESARDIVRQWTDDDAAIEDIE